MAVVSLRAGEKYAHICLVLLHKQSPLLNGSQSLAARIYTRDVSSIVVEVWFEDSLWRLVLAIHNSSVQGDSYKSVDDD